MNIDTEVAQEVTQIPGRASPPILAKKSCRDRCIELAIELRCGGYSADATAKIAARTTISTDEARALAEMLIQLADAADAKAAAKAAREERREKWREREIAAGRMKVMSAREFFGR